MKHNLRVRVLGPTSVERDGETHILRGKSAMLLGNLVASYPSTCPTPVLCDALWGTADDEATRRLLRVEVTRLRKRLGDDILFDHAGYRLTVEADAIDVLRVSNLAERARQQRAAGNLEGALSLLEEVAALAEGEPFANLGDRGSVEAFAVYISELVQATQEEVVDLMLQLGLCDESVPIASELARRSPLREKRHELLMRSLEACGRRTEALRHYQAYRQDLAEETGLEPGNQLRDTEAAIAAGTLPPPTQSRPPGQIVPAENWRLPHPTSTLVGRSDEVEAIRRALKTSRLVTLVGPPGIGKSRLAQELGHTSPEGAIWIDLSNERESTVLQALAHETASWSNEDLLGALISRFRLWEGSELVIFDNCEHLTDALAPLVSELVGRLGELQVLVTSRQPLDIDSELVLAVGPLSNPSSKELLKSRLGAIDTLAAEDLNRLVAASEGSPLLIGIVGRAALTEPKIPISSVRSSGIESSSARLATIQDQLDSETHRRLVSFGVLEGTFTESTASAVADVDGKAAQHTLRELLRHALIEVDRSGTTPRYRLHALIHNYAQSRLEDLGETQVVAARLIAHISHAVEQQSNDIQTSREHHALEKYVGDAEVTRAAWALALKQGDSEAASRIAVASFEPTFRSNHHRDLARSIETLNEIDDRDLSIPVRADLLGIVGLAYWATGRPSESIGAARRSLLIADQHGLPPSFQAMNALVAAYASKQQTQKAFEVLVNALEQAKSRGDVFFEVGMRSQLTLAAASTGFEGEALTQAEKTENTAALSGSPSCTAAALLSSGVAHVETSQRQAVGLLTTAVDIAAAAGDEWLANWTRFWLAQALVGFQPASQLSTTLHIHLLRHWQATHTRPLLNESIASSAVMLASTGAHAHAAKAAQLVDAQELSLLLPSAMRELAAIHRLEKPRKKVEATDDRLAELISSLERNS